MANFMKNIHPLLRRKQTSSEDTNYAILKAIDDLLAEAEEVTINAKSQSFLHSATQDYLNEWGQWMGVYRKDNEADDNYRKRIIKYVNIPRGTNQAIKLAIRRYLEDPNVGIEVYEPWKNIFYLNKSKLNGLDSLMGQYYRFAVITIRIGAPFDDDIEDYLNRFKPSGVKMNLIYDPTIARTNEDSSNIAINLLNMVAYSSESLVTRLTGLDNILGGRIQLSDTDVEVNPFYTDKSKMNKFDVLTGDFSQKRDYYHLASFGRQFIPKDITSMGETLLATEEAPKEAYTSTKEVDGEVAKLKLDPSKELYITMNIDRYLSKKYFGTGLNIPRTKEEYAKVLGDPEFTLVLSGDIPGKTVDFQAYDFSKGKWVTLSKVLMRNGMTKINIGMGGNTSSYLNSQRVLFTRLVPNGSIELSFDYFALDYRTEK